PAPSRQSELETFTVLTTQPNDLLAGLTTQMPVIIAPADDQTWLNPEAGEPSPLFEPFASAELQVWPVKSEVGNVRNDHSGLIEAA
ncbi:MAG: SOS response-associated peptidase family protein, partial [Pseudomonadota bacterium]